MSTAAITTLATAQEHSSHIDTLLEKYLGLLDTYTTLRAELSVAISSIHHSLARANFSSPNPRGLRWGSEAVYAASANREMRTVRRVRLVCRDDEENRDVGIEVVPGEAEDKVENQSEQKDERETSEHMEKDDEEDGEHEGQKEECDKPPNLFGILLPPTLRAARVESIKVVEEIVPHLAEVEGQMRRVEIEVRRARKRMGKAVVGGEEGVGKEKK